MMHKRKMSTLKTESLECEGGRPLAHGCGEDKSCPQVSGCGQGVGGLLSVVVDNRFCGVAVLLVEQGSSSCVCRDAFVQPLNFLYIGQKRDQNFFSCSFLRMVSSRGAGARGPKWTAPIGASR